MSFWCRVFFLIKERLFGDLGRAMLADTFEGYNTTLFSYGQTGSGKSYSVIGYGSNEGDKWHYKFPHFFVNSVAYIHRNILVILLGNCETHMQALFHSSAMKFFVLLMKIPLLHRPSIQFSSKSISLCW